MLNQIQDPDLPGRTTVFGIVKELKEAGIILNTSKRKNRNSLVLIRRNEMGFIFEKLLEFKNNYFSLLECSLKSQNMKLVIKGLENSSSPRENMISQGKLIGNLHNKFNKANALYPNIEKLTEEIVQGFSIPLDNEIGNPYTDLYDSSKFGSTPYETLQERIRSLKSLDTKLDDVKIIRKTSKIKIEKLKEKHLKIFSSIDRVKELKKRYSSHIHNSAYLVLTSCPVFLFLILSYEIKIRSITLWPNTIVDQRLLYELNEFSEKILQEIKSALIEFLDKSKNKRMKSEFETLVYNTNFADKDFYLTRMYTDYSILNLKTEIGKVLSSLNKIELKKTPYDYLDEKERLVKDIYNQINTLHKDFN